MNIIGKAFCTAAATTLLFACGGGGGSDENSAPVTLRGAATLPSTGEAINDSAIAVETEGEIVLRSSRAFMNVGVTDADGNFNVEVPRTKMLGYLLVDDASRQVCGAFVANVDVIDKDLNANTHLGCHSLVSAISSEAESRANVTASRIEEYERAAATVIDEFAIDFTDSDSVAQGVREVLKIVEPSGAPTPTPTAAETPAPSDSPSPVPSDMATSAPGETVAPASPVPTPEETEFNRTYCACDDGYGPVPQSFTCSDTGSAPTDCTEIVVEDIECSLECEAACGAVIDGGVCSFSIVANNAGIHEDTLPILSTYAECLQGCAGSSTRPV
jgi:hypothetical protein